MLKKIICIALVAAVCVATVLYVPGLLELLVHGRPGNGIVASESTLTVEETAILATEIDPSWSIATASHIELSDEGIAIQGWGAVLSEDERTITITQAGTYVINGSLSDGQIRVDVVRGDVHLVLDGMSLSCSWSSPIYVLQAGDVRISAQEGTENFLSDTANYIFEDPINEEPCATVFSNADLSFCGTGSLEINGNFRRAVHTKDRLIVADLSMTVKAAEDGLVGHDALLLKDATIVADCGLDCLKSNNYELENLGYVYITGGDYRLTAGNDAVQAEQRMLITGGEFRIFTGDGHSVPTTLISCKGVKAGRELVITGGAFSVDASDDAIHTDGRLAVTGGEFDLYTGDDALAGKQILVGGGRVRAITCLQGLVGEIVEVAGGAVSVTALDDGVLARPAPLGDEGGFTLYPGLTDVNVTVELIISGGLLVVESEGDSLDVRGAFRMSGGFALVSGPSISGGDPLDYDAAFTMTGGTLVSTGRSTFIPMLPAGDSSCIISASFSNVRPAGEYVTLRGNGGELLFSVCPAQEYYSLTVYSCDVKVGSVYALMEGGSPVGEEEFGVYRGGTLSGAKTLSSFTLTERKLDLVSRSGNIIPDNIGEGPIV